MHQEDAAAAERSSGIWSSDFSEPLPALDYSSSAADLAAALATRRSVLADKETSLQRWAVALECESARQASEQRALQARADQVMMPFNQAAMLARSYTNSNSHCTVQLIASSLCETPTVHVLVKHQSREPIHAGCEAEPGH